MTGTRTILTPAQRALGALANASKRAGAAERARDAARDVYDAAQADYERAKKLYDHAATHPDLPDPLP